MSQRYFEEFLINEEGQYPRCLGMLIHEQHPEPGRKCGYEGRKEFILTANVTLKKGHREVVVKASEKRPLKVRTMLQMIEGWKGK